MRGEMENIRDMDKEKVEKEVRRERYSAEVVNVCAAPRTVLIFRTFFFAPHWNRERGIKFPRTKRIGLLCLKKSRGSS